MRNFLVLPFLAAAAWAGAPLNTDGGLALKGYDPTTYFPESGLSPSRGVDRFEFTHDGVRYRFASDANRKRFARDPDRYRIAYGGWCATALAYGKKVDIDPTVFRVRGRDLFLFVSSDARDAWLADEAAKEKAASAQWGKLGGTATPVFVQSERSVGHRNLGKGGLALVGYDPVAYFPEGGGKPARGSEAHAWTWNGASYRFVSQDHLDRFKRMPERYEPLYGGWCAYAVGKSGKKVKIDPKAFLIRDGRLLVFFRNRKVDTRDLWNRNETGLRREADRRWGGIVGKS